MKLGVKDFDPAIDRPMFMAFPYRGSRRHGQRDPGGHCSEPRPTNVALPRPANVVLQAPGMPIYDWAEDPDVNDNQTAASGRERPSTEMWLTAALVGRHAAPV